MKIRNIVFGYYYQDGQITVNPKDAIIIREICRLYLTGKSLAQISKWLNDKKIEYMPNVYGWNAARVGRLISEKRYLGDDKHPKIIDIELHEKLVVLKTSKNTQVGLNRGAEIFKLNVPVRCPKCNGLMYRRFDKRREIKSRWDCTNPECNCVVAKDDEPMLEAITETLNEIISNPQIISIPTEATEIEPNMELIKANNEISRMCNSADMDGTEIRLKMLEYVSLLYKEIDSEKSDAQRLKDIFAEAIPLKAFCLPLFERTVDEIKLYIDGKIGLVLNNKQEIIKGRN